MVQLFRKVLGALVGSKECEVNIERLGLRTAVPIEISLSIFEILTDF